MPVRVRLVVTRSCRLAMEHFNTLTPYAYIVSSLQNHKLGSDTNCKDPNFSFKFNSEIKGRHNSKQVFKMNLTKNLGSQLFGQNLNKTIPEKFKITMKRNFKIDSDDPVPWPATTRSVIHLAHPYLIKKI